MNSHRSYSSETVSFTRRTAKLESGFAGGVGGDEDVDGIVHELQDPETSRFL